MTIGNITRIIRSGAPLALVLALALVLVPVGASAKQSDASQSGVYVCNTAHQGGTMTADDQDVVHYADGLAAMKNTNINAASHSRALSLCSPEQSETPASGASGMTI